MSLFKNMLGSEESLFMNAIALDYDFMPKLIPYRETEQKHIATCVRPLFQQRNGRNLIITGTPGVGKTVATRNVLQELEEETDEVTPIYINCWQKNTSYKIVLHLCEELGYKFTQNKKTTELFDEIKRMLNKTSAVIVFDEIDKAEEYDFLYMLLEEIYRKTIVLITNYKDWINGLDERIKSRLMAEMMEFRSYNKQETEGILRERMEYAFVKGVMKDDAFNQIVDKTYELKDIRTGLYLMRESGNSAEDRSSKEITLEDAQTALEKLKEFSEKDKSTLEEDEKLILDIIKETPGIKIGDLYKKYESLGGKGVYKTLQRRIAKLDKDRFIKTKQVQSKDGNTTLISMNEVEKKLDEF